MRRILGLDIHKSEKQACIMDARGHVVEEKRFPTTKGRLSGGVEEVPKGRHEGPVPDAPEEARPCQELWGSSLWLSLPPSLAGEESSGPQRIRTADRRVMSPALYLTKLGARAWRPRARARARGRVAFVGACAAARHGRASAWVRVRASPHLAFSG